MIIKEFGITHERVEKKNDESQADDAIRKYLIRLELSGKGNVKDML